MASVNIQIVSNSGALVLSEASEYVVSIHRYGFDNVARPETAFQSVARPSSLWTDVTDPETGWSE